MGWDIFPFWAGIVLLIAATSATWAIFKKERSTVAIATMSLAICYLIYTQFIRD